MNATLRQVKTLLLKDLTREWRSKEVLTTTLAFSLLLMLVFTFSFYRSEQNTGFIFPGILWVSIAFSGTLAVGRAFQDEKESGCLRALALIPNMANSLYLAKFMINFVMIALFELVLIPLLLVSFNIDFAGRWAEFVGIVFLGTIGFTALGTLMAAMLVHHKLREAILPLILYPLLIPLFIGGAKGVSELLTQNMDAYWTWIKMMAGMDVLFLIGAQTLFGSVLNAIE